jgi:hypothetical protein
MNNNKYNTLWAAQRTFKRFLKITGKHTSFKNIQFLHKIVNIFCVVFQTFLIQKALFLSVFVEWKKNDFCFTPKKHSFLNFCDYLIFLYRNKNVKMCCQRWTKWIIEWMNIQRRSGLNWIWMYNIFYHSLIDLLIGW